MTPHPNAVIHDPDDDQTWERLARHLTGESPADESADTVAWAAAQPERARLLESTALTLALAQSELPDVPGGRPANVSADAAWPAVEARIDEEAPALTGPVTGGFRESRAGARSPSDSVRAIVLPAERTRRRQRRATGMLLRAAAVVLVAGGAALLFRGGISLRQTVEAPVAAAPTPPVPPREFATRRGQRSTFYLTDGTRVVLGPGSILRVRAGLGPDVAVGAREVTLEGEAYFDVKHDDARPFSVHGAAGVARDLGTAFTVRSYSAERAMRVAVASGFVSLRGLAADTTHADSLLLRAGDAGEAAIGALPARLPGTQVAPLLAWTRDTLVFADAPLARVAAELERWYSVRVVVADTSLARERLTAVVPRGDLTEVLDVIRLAMGVQMQREGSRVVLRRE